MLHHEAPAQRQERFGRGYQHLLNDLGITSSADLRRRSEQVEASLPQVCEVAEAIMPANRSIDSQ